MKPFARPNGSMTLRAACMCLVAVPSGCVAQPGFFLLDGKPYQGSDPSVLGMKRAQQAGLMPVSISCRMPRTGPGAKPPVGPHCKGRMGKSSEAYGMVCDCR